jgi:hypothetical protein
MHKHRSRHPAAQPHAASARPSAPVRVGDADRERVVELLRGHAVAGRLDTDELEDRLERVYAARYGAELQAVLAELPTAPERSRRPARHSRPAPALLPLALGALIATAALSSAWWLLWLIWPLVVVLGPHPRHHRLRGAGLSGARRHGDEIAARVGAGYRSPSAAASTIDASMSHSTGARSSV